MISNGPMGLSQNQIETIKAGLDRDGIQKVVVGAVIRRAGQVLLLKRRSDDFMGGLVELPSGTVDSGETIVEALAREVLEETGLEVRAVESFLGAFDYLSGSGKKTRQLNFLVVASSGEVSLDPAEHTDFYWLDPGGEQFDCLNISDETRRVVRQSLAGR